VKRGQSGFIVDRSPIDRADEANELTRLYAFQICEHSKQFDERAGVWATQGGGFFFAMEIFPRAEQASIVSELFI
jgi:hypothetical protein